MRRGSGWWVLGWLLLAMSPTAAPAQEQVPERQSESIQAWLERMRSERAATRESLSLRVGELCRELEALSAEPTQRKVEATRNALRALGPEALDLMVQAIDPGVAASAAAKFRAREVAIAIALERPHALAEELLRLVAEGSSAGRSNALHVLASHGQPERVIPGLIQLFQSKALAERTQVLAVLAQLGGPQVDQLLQSSLGESDAEVLAAALDALIQTKSVVHAPAVLAFLGTPGAPAQSERILAYYHAARAAMDQTHARALLTMAGHAALTERSRARTIEALAGFALKLDDDLEAPLQRFVDGGTREVRESALVVLSVLGERNARKTLLKPFEETIKKSPKWPQAYLQLAQVLLRIHDYKKAIPEFKTALELQSKEDRVDAEPYLGIARCHARMGDYKEAAQYLENAPLSLKTLRELAQDVDFAEMAANPRYNKAFHLDSDS